MCNADIGPRFEPDDTDSIVFYDGGCPLCMREIRMLKGRDRRQRIRFVDIAADGLDCQGVLFGKSSQRFSAEFNECRRLSFAAPMNPVS